MEQEAGGFKQQCWGGRDGEGKVGRAGGCYPLLLLGPFRLSSPAAALARATDAISIVCPSCAKLYSCCPSRLDLQRPPHSAPPLCSPFTKNVRNTHAPLDPLSVTCQIIQLLPLDFDLTTHLSCYPPSPKPSAAPTRTSRSSARRVPGCKASAP